MLETNGKVKSVHVEDLKGERLKGIIFNHVSPGTTIQSDEYNAYNGLEWMGYNHIRCDHGRYQYVADNGANTNKCENYYSNMKRLFHGTYHKMTAKHVQKYLAESDFRYNTRNMGNQQRFDLLLQNSAVRLKYSQLISNRSNTIGF